jgi:predicted secreted protein
MEEIELRKGERSIVTLKGLGSAGYRWSFTVDDPRIVRVEHIAVTKKPGDFPPSHSLDEQFAITGRVTGETVVRFSLARPFEQAKPPIATREILAHVR